MPPETSDKVAESNLSNKHHDTDRHTTPNSNFALLRLKTMLTSLGQQSLEIASMDFASFKSLSLTSLQLAHLPANFAHLMTGLQFLDLSDNLLEELPFSVHHLTKLESLKINRNALSSLPNSLIQLKYLRHLSLVSNQLTQLPDAFGCLSHLESLDLTENQLQSLPISCAKLNMLSSLILRRNRLSAMPAGVTNGIKNLRRLDLSENQHICLNMPPASIHLEAFIAEDNQCCGVFPGWLLWVKYCKLKLVKLDKTTFKRYSCPREHIALQITSFSAKHSNMSENVVEDIVWSMVKLEKLDLSNLTDSWKCANTFMQVPFERMRVMNGLKELNIRNTGVAYVSARISEFRNLVMLDLSYNDVTWLPEEVTLLEKLEILRVGQSKLIQLPVGIGKMRALRELWAAQNSISQLPEGLFELRHLRLLDLYDNCISEVSEGIGAMLGLQQLDLDMNLYDASAIEIGGICYKKLKESLRIHANCDNQKRVNEVKVEPENVEDDDSYGSRHSHFSRYTDSDEESNEEESDESLSKRCKSASFEEEEEEDWDSQENISDNFEPCDAGFFRSGVNFYMSASAINNYYCPADDHVKPVRQILADQMPFKADTFEEGQFDDA